MGGLCDDILLNGNTKRMVYGRPLVDQPLCPVCSVTVIRNLPIYGNAINRVRFLVQREKFHFGLLQSQRFSLPRRMRSRVTHGTCPVLLFIRKLGFRFLAKERAGTLANTLVFLPKEANYLGTHKHYSVFQGTTLLFSHTVSKAEVVEMSRKGEESLCFRELVSTPESCE